MANLDFVSVCLAIPDLVPSWFGVSPVGGANTGFCQWGGSCWCGRGWDSGSAHLCNGESDVNYGFGERYIGGHQQVLDGGVFYNCPVCQIIKRKKPSAAPV